MLLYQLWLPYWRLHQRRYNVLKTASSTMPSSTESLARYERWWINLNSPGDVFCVYEDPETYTTFSNWLNQLHPTIKFTFFGNKHQVNFLDTTDFKTPQGTLALKPYKKTIDKNTYLHYRSCHPRALWQSIPYGQFARLRRNSTLASDFKAHSLNMQRDFCRWGYPSDLVRDAAKQASVTPREKFLQYRRKEDVTYKGITAALDFTPLATQIKRIVNTHWHMGSDLPGCNNPPRWGLQKTKSFKDILIKSDMRDVQLPTPTVTGHHRCGSCICRSQAWNTKETDLPSKKFYKRLDFFSFC